MAWHLHGRPLQPATSVITCVRCGCRAIKVMLRKQVRLQQRRLQTLLQRHQVSMLAPHLLLTKGLMCCEATSFAAVTHLQSHLQIEQEHRNALALLFAAMDCAAIGHACQCKCMQLISWHYKLSETQGLTAGVHTVLCWVMSGHSSQLPSSD